MKILFILLLASGICSYANGKEIIYQGSTPADIVVRNFLGISLTDSIDFIKWQLVINTGHYDLGCEYGLAKGGTSGFTEDKRVALSGALQKQSNYLQLHQKNKVLYLVVINSSLLHLLDADKNLLTGNGGYSYVLNNTVAEKKDQFNHSSKREKIEYLVAYRGRTPCQELSVLIGRNSSSACDKLKWYIIFFTDSLTGKPLYYLEGGRQYRKATMSRGKWEIIQRNGRVIYKLEIDRRTKPLYLLKAGDNILFFIDAEGKLLVGDEKFSYTLNRTKDREP